MERYWRKSCQRNESTYLLTMNTQFITDTCGALQNNATKCTAKTTNIHTSFLTVDVLTETSDNPRKYCNGFLFPLQMEKFSLFDLRTVRCCVGKALSNINLFSWRELHTCSLYSSVSSSCGESCGGSHVPWMHGIHCLHISLPSVLPRGCHLCTADMVVPWVASWRTLKEQIHKWFIRSVYLR